MGNFETVSIDKFLGMDVSRNVLGLYPGQLTDNQNYHYMSNGGLEERGGGAKLSEPPAASVLFGLGNLIIEDGTEYLITAQGTDLYNYDAGWNALGLALTTSLRTRFEGAGAGTSRALYAVNGTDAVQKVYDSGGITAAAVASSPTDLTYLKNHKSRMFGITASDTLKWTDVNAYDTWAVGTNDVDIAPGIDGRLQSLAIWGDALFIFKERGVYVLPNAADSPADWKILKTDAVIGTQSPDSVVTTARGVMYLGTDNYIRLISPDVTFSSGEYTLGGSGSPIVSFAIQEDIDALLQQNARDSAFAIYYKDKYIIGFQSVNNSGSYNDAWYFADISKALPGRTATEVPQPFWGKYTGFNYDFMTVQTATTIEKLYGAKGAVDSMDGEVHETLNSGIHNDNGEAITSIAILGWVAPGGEGLYKRFRQFYFIGDTEDWNIDLKFDGYRLGGIVPSDGSGVDETFTTGFASASVGAAIVGTATVSVIGVSSQRYRLGIRGHYFKVEFKNANADQFTRINKLVVYFRPITQN